MGMKKVRKNRKRRKKERWKLKKNIEKGKEKVRERRNRKIWQKIKKYKKDLELKKRVWDKEQKRFYTRGALRGITISWLAKIPTLYCDDWLRPLK